MRRKALTALIFISVAASGHAQTDRYDALANSPMVVTRPTLETGKLSPSPSLVAMPDPTPSPVPQSSQRLPDGHYEYVFQDGQISIYQIGGTFPVINSFAIPTSDGTRGAAACTNGMLWISHGSDQTAAGAGKLLEYDLLTGKIIYDVTYSHGIDSHAVTNDCSTIYMPDGDLSKTGIWHVVDASTGTDVGQINGPSHPHNTMLNESNTHVYMGGRQSSTFQAANTSNNAVYLSIPVSPGGVRPFRVNSAETFGLLSITALNGFQVVDLINKKVLYTVQNGRECGSPSPSHGVTINPAQTEVWVLDYCSDSVHVYDITELPSQAPQPIKVIFFTKSMHHYESPCAYGCGAEGWLHHSLDGRYVFVGDVGDVIDTSTHAVVANLPALYNTRKMIEIDWAGGAVVKAMKFR
jgi:DNA-binding beta-propeller fold protein YncE